MNKTIEIIITILLVNLALRSLLPPYQYINPVLPGVCGTIFMIYCVGEYYIKKEKYIIIIDFVGAICMYVVAFVNLYRLFK